MPGKQSRPSAIGRFAPSPTGDLHFGSLLAAVASFLQAKSGGGQWLVRVEDIDPPREVADSAASILRDLEQFGLRPDRQVLYQSTRQSAYNIALNELLEQGLAFHCGCSRSDLPDSGVYPGTCRDGLPPGKQARTVRVRAPQQPIVFSDQIQGTVEEDLEQTVGDFVLWRADGLPAYQLAVVVDDAFQDITEVVRGADLLSSTARQIWLQHCLGLPTPTYAHHPVALAANGKKLSKRLGSDPLARQVPARALASALRFLGQPCPDGLGLEESWCWALQNWRLSAIPRQPGQYADDPPRGSGASAR